MGPSSGSSFAPSTYAQDAQRLFCLVGLMDAYAVQEDFGAILPEQEHPEGCEATKSQAPRAEVVGGGAVVFKNPRIAWQEPEIEESHPGFGHGRVMWPTNFSFSWGVAFALVPRANHIRNGKTKNSVLGYLKSRRLQVVAAANSGKP